MKINNKEIKIGYKIVRLDLYSFCRSPSAGGIEYKLNQKVYPNKRHGPLCVFDSLEDTKNFLYNYSLYNYKVFKCNYEESNEDKAWSRYSIEFTEDLFPRTKLASWVELTEEIEL